MAYSSGCCCIEKWQSHCDVVENMNLFGIFFRFISELKGRKLSLAQAAQQLDASGRALAARIRAASSTPRSIEQARHIIGIERWGQSRLKRLLGGPVLNDEYNGSRPDELDTLPALAAAFAATRAETVALLDALRQAGKTGAETAAHNDLGDLSIVGWAIYLDDHALREAMLIR